MEAFILNQLYPISLNLENKLCLIVGGGNVAFRRASKLLASGAMIKVLSPTINAKLKTLIGSNPNILWVKTPYTGPKDLYGSYLVFAASDDPALNQEIGEDAASLGIFANIASSGQLSDFIVPSSFNQGDLQVTVSTSGKVPGLSKAISKNLKETLGPEYKILINLLGQVRNEAIAESHHKKENRHILSDITANYLSILEGLASGTDVDTLYQDLLNILK